MRTLTHYELDYREQPQSNYERFHSPYTHLADYTPAEYALACEVLRHYTHARPEMEFRLVACYQGVA